MKVYVSITALILLASGALQAGEFYVSPNGNASWSQCTVINTPCSAATAMQNAFAGDTTFFRGGTYSITGGRTPYHGLLEPQNSGTQANPIVFMAYDEEIPVISVNCTSPDNQCIAIGTNAKDYITWDGFTLTTSNNKTAGIFMGGVSSYSTGAVFKNSTVIAGSLPVPSSDNFDITRMEKTINATFSNNIVGGLKTSGSSTSDNNAALKMYNNDGAIVEYNELYGSPHGLSGKSDLDNALIRNNFFHDNHIDFLINIFASGEPWHCPNNRIYDNVFANFRGIAITIQASSNTVADADNMQIYNNTFYTTASGDVWAMYLGNATNLQIYNNIIIAPSQITTKGNHSTVAAADHNQYGNGYFFNELNRYNNNSTYGNLSSWKTSGQLVGGGNPGDGSLASDPLFLNSTGTMSFLNDFKLATGSPSIGSGRNGSNMGANINIVGPNNLKAPPKPPTMN